jgi:hypothetical protein
LLVDRASPDVTVAALRDILVNSPNLYDRGVPVRLAIDSTKKQAAVAHPLSADDLVLLAHQASRPYLMEGRAEVDVRLPNSIARMYLGWRREWHLRPLNGIASAPLLRDEGEIVSGSGYDPVTGMWQDNVPDLKDRIASRPTEQEAADALRLIRKTFKTFCFADARTVLDETQGVFVVDLCAPPGQDESGFLVTLLTAICRPSLQLAPGIVFRAAPISGAGTGKGLLARCISIVAFGHEPHAVTAGANPEELEKRIAAELIQANPVLFLDNLNNTSFRSNLLASAITEHPARVRLLGRSHMVQLNSSALVILTGNGLRVSEDLARRFITVDFDALMENPEARTFAVDIKAEVIQRRAELLAALLTIWRWGRQMTGLSARRTLGSFETWGRWVRDPLLALGCSDPAARINEAKRFDARRQAVSNLFAIWMEKHGSSLVQIADLDQEVKRAADPHQRGPQFLASYISRLVGTRLGGLGLTRHELIGSKDRAFFALRHQNASRNADRHL